MEPSTTWLRETELEGTHVRLIPLRREHRRDLVAAADDGELWRLWFTGVPSTETVESYVDFALGEQRAGRALAFVIVHRESGDVIGSTRFCNADPSNRRVEIGYTFYAQRFQRTAINTECKLLLLTHAFDVLDAIAVEFRTHWHNHASRNAIARLGAKQDGVLRSHMIDAAGNLRDTVVFSIIASEWPTVRFGLRARLARG